MRRFLCLLLLVTAPVWADPRQEALQQARALRDRIGPAIASGNFRTAQSLSTATGALLTPKYGADPEAQELYLDQLDAGFQSSSYMSSSLTEQLAGFSLKFFGSKRPAAAMRVSVALLHWAVQAQRPQKWDEYLAQAKTRLQAFSGPEQAHFAFVVHSYDVARQYQKAPPNDWQAVARDWDAQRAPLPDPALPAGSARTFWRAQSLWRDAMVRSGAPFEEVDRRLNLAGDSLEFRLCRLHERVGLARVYWEITGKNPSLSALQAEVTALEARLKAEDHRLAPGDPKFAFSWLQGDYAYSKGTLALLEYRIRYASRLSELEAEDMKHVRELFLAAEDHLHLAALNQNANDGDVVSWDLIDVMLARAARNPGWRKDAQSILNVTRASYDIVDSRLGRAQAGYYQGEIFFRSNELAPAETALLESIGLVETYVTEVGGTRAAEQQQRQRFRRAYELLAQVQMKMGKPQAAVETLGRWQQVESLPTPPPRLRELQSEVSSGEKALQDTSSGAVAPAGGLQQSRQNFYAELSRLRQTEPLYEARLAVRPVNFSQLQAQLPANVALVQYLPLKERLVLFCLTREKLATFEVPIGDSQLTDSIRRLRGDILLAEGWNPALAQKLYSWLVAPARPALAGKDTVVFIPTGFLSYVPFAALVDDKGKFLIESVQCAVVSKSADLANLGHPTAAPQSVLALGNPDGSLPGAEKECKDIYSLFGKGDLRLGNQASSQSLSGQKAPIIHLATHGMLNARDPDTSYLLMAGQGPGAHLLLTDIYGLNLKDVRLVTLSACQTALAEREPTSELASLAEAFSIAGSPSVIASLWKVEDTSTHDLMVSFYAGLKRGGSLAESLGQAQREMLKSPKFRHPFFWSGFVLLGDWR